MKTLFLLRKSIFTIREEGFSSLLRKVANYLDKSNCSIGGGKNRRLTVVDLLNRKFRNLQELSYLVTNSNELRINLVTDSLEPSLLFGGVITTLVISTMWAKHKNCKLRIITRTAPINAQAYYKSMKLNEIDHFPEVEFYTDHDRDKYGNPVNKLDVGKHEIFIATSWWSAYAIRKTFPYFKIVYILQEVETYFYPHGDEHSLCHSVMQDKNIVFLVNTKLLYDFFRVNEKNVFERGYSFEPAFVKSLYKLRIQDNDKKRKYRLFFYARPNNPRNLFYRGIDFLNKGINAGVINTNEWDIVCLGSNIPTVIFDNGAQMVNGGILDLNKYGEFLANIDLALSLMYTPHPSYPPYDVLCSGGVVLTNTCANKKDFNFSENAILFDLNDEKDFLEKLERAIKLAKNEPLRKKNFKNSTISRSWDDSLKEAIAFLDSQF